MSFRPMMKCQGEWCGNDLRFSTRDEAERSAKDLYSRWTVPSEWRVDESPDPVNYERREGRDVRLPDPTEAEKKAWLSTSEARRMGEAPLLSHEGDEDED